MKILGFCIAAAIAYGVVHDQFTARICIEYFTVFHPRIFASQSPTVLAIGWGILATWWVGGALGSLLAIAARIGSRPKLAAQHLLRPIGKLLLFMAACAALFGLVGFTLTEKGVIPPPQWVALTLPRSAYSRFMADWWAHNASYASGIVGGLLLCMLTYRKRISGSVPYEEMNSIRCRGVLFDLDGVLVDSTPAVARVWAAWAREHGFDPDKTVRNAHGKPSIATIRELLPNADHEAENCEMERREIADTDGVIPLPGALELLQAIPREKWAIVTSCTRLLAGVRIEAAGLPKPKYMVTSTDVVRGKPDPEPYLKGAEILGISAADCVVLEDAPAGIRAGKTAGMRVVALRTTASDTELREAGADWIVDDCAELFANSADHCETFVLVSRRTK